MKRAADANPGLRDLQPSALLCHMASYSCWQEAQGPGEKAQRPLGLRAAPGNGMAALAACRTYGTQTDLWSSRISCLHHPRTFVIWTRRQLNPNWFPGSYSARGYLFSTRHIKRA